MSDLRTRTAPSRPVEKRQQTPIKAAATGQPAGMGSGKSRRNAEEQLDLFGR